MSEEPEQQEQSVKKTAKATKPVKKNFTQISAIQRYSKGLTIYTASVPFPFAAQAFNFDGTDKSPEERAQRSLDPRHAKKIRQYLENNEESYYLPPLIVSVNGDAEFTPSRKDGDMGTLTIGMNALYRILDGQHRTAAIRGLLDKNATKERFKEEHISVDFLIDIELDQAKTYFRLLNATGKTVSKNLTALYADDVESRGIHDILVYVPLFSDLVEKEKTNLNPKNEKLFVYKWLFEATKRMKPRINSEFDKIYCESFWRGLSDIIPQWKAAFEGTLTAQQIREEYISTAGIFIEALGEVGAILVASCQDNPEKVVKYLSHLKNVDWSKNNAAWHNQVVDSNGKLLSRSGSRKFLTEFMLDKMNLAHKLLAA
ncbi:MAG: DNA sulfur modification protein DndB [Brasilonema angustatum HA4187-MV1]|jgi:DNA sulfur modification protein DndB|nr:DNA sulfur modification protein DndB [Brasilonema angustatum HA4187-MV1]